MTDLGALGGNYSEATGINDSGQVVGYSNTEEPAQRGVLVFRPFITGPNGKGMTDLGALGEVDEAFAADINDAGQVVGYSQTKELVDPFGNLGNHAFITGPGGVGMIDINSYADLPDGYFLASASGINNLGQVVGNVHPIPPIPEPTSYALMLAGLGLVGFMARWKKPADNSVARG